MLEEAGQRPEDGDKRCVDWSGVEKSVNSARTFKPLAGEKQSLYL